MHIIVETPRLYLRQFTLADTGYIYRLNSNPEVLKYLHERPLVSEKDAAGIIRTAILPQYKNNLGRWAMFTKTGNEFLGWCGLKHRPELDEIDLGYRLMQEAWGKGYAAEAAKHCIDYGFEKLSLKEITGRAHIENHVSLHILQKIGMRYIKDEVVDDCPVKTFSISRQ